MSAATATCRHCGKSVEFVPNIATPDPGYWLHVDPWLVGNPHGFRSVLCDPRSGGGPRAEPASAAPPAVEPVAWAVMTNEGAVGALYSREDWARKMYPGAVVRPLFLSSKVVER